MIGERLAEVRKDHGDTQQSLAKKLNVTKFTVSSWEQEKSEPNHEMLVTICRLYHVSSDYLLGLSDIDPAYIGHRMEKLDREDQALLKELEEFLIWRKETEKRSRKLSSKKHSVILRNSLNAERKTKENDPRD